MLVPKEFRSLAEILRGIEPAPDRPIETQQAAQSAENVVESHAEPAADFEALVRDVRLFRAHIAEAVDACVERLVHAIAQTVLARELELAPCDIDAIVDSCLAMVNGARDLRIVVHPEDAALVRTASTESDPVLERGDCIVRLDSGSIHATLQLRLRDAIEAGLR